MSVPAPHFLLLAEAGRGPRHADWRFEIRTADGQQQFEVADEEPADSGERVELLAVVRGLEALDQPSSVTLMTPSGYVNRGLTYGLEEWRTNQWRWERDGKMVPVKNGDLWRRLDQAMRFHRVQCAKRTGKFTLTAQNSQFRS